MDLAGGVADEARQLPSKVQLVEKLYDFDAEVESNTIEVHVSSLRKKLGTIRPCKRSGSARPRANDAGSSDLDVGTMS